jgi:hypothetical protein
MPESRESHSGANLKAFTRMAKAVKTIPLLSSATETPKLSIK